MQLESELIFLVWEGEECYALRSTMFQKLRGVRLIYSIDVFLGEKFVIWTAFPENLVCVIVYHHDKLEFELQTISV